MNHGVFCKTKSSTDIYNSILIDEYHKCIFGEDEMMLEQHENKTMNAGAGISADLNVNSSTPCESNISRNPMNFRSELVTDVQPQWEPGMNVRAPYFVDDGVQYFEAKILKIFDDKFVTIEFFGYDEEHVVRLFELLSSEGDEAIKEQIKAAKEEYVNEDDGDEDEEEEEETNDWQVGMACRAYYEPMDIIYEATIERVDPANRTASVSITGYDTRFNANFSQLFRSDPHLREKQMNSAQKHNAIQEGTSNVKKSGSKSFNILNSSVHSQGPSKSGQSTFESRPHHSNCAPGPAFQPSRESNIIQPNDENEALACLLSSNYLSGYYAGYYDCLKKVPMKSKQDISKGRQTYTQLS